MLTICKTQNFRESGLPNSYDMATITSPAGESILLPLMVARYKVEKHRYFKSQTDYAFLSENESEKFTITESLFDNETTLGNLETNKRKDIVAAKTYAEMIGTIFETDKWISDSNGLDICSNESKLGGWDHHSRVAVVRKSKREHQKSGRQSVFEESDELANYLIWHLL